MFVIVDTLISLEWFSVNKLQWFMESEIGKVSEFRTGSKTVSLLFCILRLFPNKDTVLRVMNGWIDEWMSE